MKKQKEKEEIIRMRDIYANQMDYYQKELAQASKGYSYWNHKLKEFVLEEKK